MLVTATGAATVTSDTQVGKETASKHKISISSLTAACHKSVLTKIKKFVQKIYKQNSSSKGFKKA